MLRSVRLLFSVRGGRCTLSVMAKLRVQVRQVRKAEKSGGNPWWGRATDRHMETFTSTRVSSIPTSRHLQVFFCLTCLPSIPTCHHLQVFFFFCLTCLPVSLPLAICRRLLSDLFLQYPCLSPWQVPSNLTRLFSIITSRHLQVLFCLTRLSGIPNFCYGKSFSV